MKATPHKTSPLHEAVYQDLCAALAKYSDKLTPPELLALAANLVGKLIALQDQRTMTPEMALKTVMLNIEKGNEDARREMQHPKGTA